MTQTEKQRYLAPEIDVLEMIVEQGFAPSNSNFEDPKVLGWVEGWHKAGWRRGRDELKNPDLWDKLFSLTEMHEVTFIWVKGHDGHAYNERCDRLATAYADSFL